MSDITPAIEGMVEAHRRLYPEDWKAADAIARIVDPGAFGEWHNGATGEPREPTTRQRYAQSVAYRKAWEILRYLDLAPEHTDWVEIFTEMAAESGTPVEEQEP